MRALQQRLTEQLQERGVQSVIRSVRFLPVLAGVMVAACTWVKPTDKGAGVRVAGADEVHACTPAGTTQVSVLDKVGVVRRGYSKVSEELITLARNSAAQLGGDTIVPISEIADGVQTFAVYRCR
jgi:hypothetical protein